MTASRAPRRDAAENRSALLDAARGLLNRDPAASLEAIASAAGLSRRTVYGHFPTRDALLAALAERGTTRVVASVAGIADADPVARLALIAAAAWDEVAAIRVMTMTTLASSRAAIVDDGLAPLRHRLAEAIAEGSAAGRLRNDMPAARVARLVEDAVVASFPLTIREALDADAGRLLVVRVALGVAGLGWREVAALLDARPDIVAPRPREEALWPPTDALRTVTP
ncbi:MAG: TetR/AcrR family transcriptional regulator [Micrococcales bacterium]|nr:TetR/AcrR family transcriptional regulator [Micrococcales bacterium]